MTRISITCRLLLVAAILMMPLIASAYYVPCFDPDQSGKSDIADVSAVINCLLGHGDEGVNPDVDCDGRVSLSDVNLMIDYLFYPERYDYPRYGVVYPEFDIPENAEIFSVNGVSFAMVPIDTIDEQGNLVHKFSLGLTEVTAELWEAVTGFRPSIGIPYPRWPVSIITWYDACEFIDSLNMLTGREFRLPSTAEWEYAARGGLLFHQYDYAGSDDCNEVCWYNNNLLPNWYYYGCAVGLKKPNELGLYDMSGNVSEWCSDYMGYPGGMPYLDLINVVGGCWGNHDYECTISSSIRAGFIPEESSIFVGMRLAL